MEVTLKCLHHKNYDGTLVAVTVTRQSAESTSVCEGFQHPAGDPSYPDLHLHLRHPATEHTLITGTLVM